MGNRGSFRQGPARSRVAGLNLILDGAGAVLTTGLKAAFEVPFPSRLLYWKLEVTDGTSGSCVIDIRRLSEAERIGGVAQGSANSICASNKPTLSSQSRAVDYALSGWDIALQAEDWLYFNVDSASTITRVTLVLGLRRLLA